MLTYNIKLIKIIHSLSNPIHTPSGSGYASLNLSTTHWGIGILLPLPRYPNFMYSKIKIESLPHSRICNKDIIIVHFVSVFICMIHDISLLKGFFPELNPLIWNRPTKWAYKKLFLSTSLTFFFGCGHIVFWLAISCLFCIDPQTVHTLDWLSVVYFDFSYWLP